MYCISMSFPWNYGAGSPSVQSLVGLYLSVLAGEFKSLHT